MAGLIDRTLRGIAPRAYERRVTARARGDLMAKQHDRVREYDGAGKGKRLSKWRPRNRSADTEARRAQPTLRARSRDLKRNNKWIARALQAIVSHAVGTGIVPRIRSTGTTSVAERRAQRARQIYRSWAETTACDAAGRRTFVGLQAQVMATVAEAGECLVRRRWRRPSDGVPANLQLQVLEPDHLATERDGWTRSGNRVVHGIEFDQIGQRVAYHLYEQHPGETDVAAFSARVTRVPASEVIHVYYDERPGQVVGVPWTAPIMLTAKTLDDFEYAELVKQQISACYVAFKTRQPSELDESESSSSDDEGAVELTPGMIEDLEPGEDVEFGQPPAAQGFGEFSRHQIRGIASGMGLTYEIVAGDLSSVNFTSGRMGRMELHKNIDRWQGEMLIPQLCHGTMTWFLEALEMIGVRTDEIDTRWIPPARPLLEPHREVPAQERKIRAGLSTISRELREQGLDPEEVFEERAADDATQDRLGLVTTADPRKTTGSGGVADHDADDDSQQGGQS